MKECQCCAKNFRNLTKCFCNTKCTWKSCNSCIVKQIKLVDGVNYEYSCPHCQKVNNYHKHSRFAKFIKQNRSALKKILQLQNDYIKKITEKVNRIHYICLTNTTESTELIII